MPSGQIIATSHDLTPNGGLVKEIPLFAQMPSSSFVGFSNFHARLPFVEISFGGTWHLTEGAVQTLLGPESSEDVSGGGIWGVQLGNRYGRYAQNWVILLMAEIPNNHLGWC